VAFAERRGTHGVEAGRRPGASEVSFDATVNGRDDAEVERE
jgi:hypothetical protein